MQGFLYLLPFSVSLAGVLAQTPLSVLFCFQRVSHSLTLEDKLSPALSQVPVEGCFQLVTGFYHELQW